MNKCFGAKSCLEHGRIIPVAMVVLGLFNPFSFIPLALHSSFNQTKKATQRAALKTD